MEGRWRIKMLSCGLYLLIILSQSESKPSPPSDYAEMFASNYAKVSRSGILPVEAKPSENVTRTIEAQVSSDGSCCGGAGFQGIVYPENSSDYSTLYPENHRNTNVQIKTASEDAIAGGRSYKEVTAPAPKSPALFHTAYVPKKLSYDSFFQPQEVNIPQFAQDRFSPGRIKDNKPETSRPNPPTRPAPPAQLPYQPDFSDSVNTYLPPPPQKTYDDGPAITSYDAKDTQPPEQSPVFPYAPDYSPSDGVVPDSGYDYPPPDAIAPKKPEKSPPYMQLGPGSMEYMHEPETKPSKPEVHSLHEFVHKPPEMDPMHKQGPLEGYSYTPPPSLMSPEGHPSGEPSYKPPNIPPMHEEESYKHSIGPPKKAPMMHEEHQPYEDTYKPPKPKPNPKSKSKPDHFFPGNHGVPPEKLMPPSPEIPHFPGYKSPHSSHNEWLFEPESNEYYYHPHEEKVKKPPKTQKPKDEPPAHDDEHFFFDEPEHHKHHEYEHEHHEMHHKKKEPKEPKKPEEMEDHESEDRLNKRPYSYYYIGRKLWFVPLYFSVYFIIYVTALILKSIARHKISYPNHNKTPDWAGRNARQLLDHATENVTRGLENVENKYNM